MARTEFPESAKRSNGNCNGHLGFKATLWAAADKLRGNMDAIFDTITASTFAASRVVLPPKALLVGFKRAIVPHFQRMLANIEESLTRAELRDTLRTDKLRAESIT